MTSIGWEGFFVPSFFLFFLCICLCLIRVVSTSASECLERLYSRRNDLLCAERSVKLLGQSLSQWFASVDNGWPAALSAYCTAVSLAHSNHAPAASSQCVTRSWAGLGSRKRRCSKLSDLHRTYHQMVAQLT